MAGHSRHQGQFLHILIKKHWIFNFFMLYVGYIK